MPLRLALFISWLLPGVATALDVIPPSGTSRPTVLVALAGRDEAELSRLLARQRDPQSAEYRRWLTPREFGARFGARASDVRRASRWLRAAGCRVRRFTGRRMLGCVGVARLEVPEELRGVVAETIRSDDHPPVALHLQGGAGTPSASARGRSYFTPREFARVYGLGSAIGAFVDGRGQTIGILAVSSIDGADVAAFRDAARLPPLDLEQVLVTRGAGRLPGTPFEDEAVLDVTWAGAVAPGARVVLAVGTAVADSLVYLVNRGDVGIISSSLTLCPSRASRPFIKVALQQLRQAAAQGQTVLFASGDDGPTSCERAGVDPIAASPWVTAVGGTDPAPATDARGAFLGYGTESVWSDASGASGGGASPRPRPRWQRGRSNRTIPDVAFPATTVYPIVVRGELALAGGTSAAAPAWAGAIAQLNQVLGRQVGFLNPALYQLGREQARGGPAAFHDITEGRNSFGAARGYAARPGYDLATGWGSMNGPEFFAAFPR